MYRQVAHHKVFGKMAELQVRVIDRYRHSAALKQNSDARFMHLALEGTLKRVQKGERDTSELDFYDAELEMIQKIHELSEQLAVIALYRVVELSYGWVVRFALRAWTIPDWTSSKVEREGRVRELFGFSMADVINNAVADELRLLNNAIKHHNKVTQQLARYEGWEVGRDLPLLSTAYERIAPRVPDHIQNFAERVFVARPPNSRLQASASGTLGRGRNRRHLPAVPEPES